MARKMSSPGLYPATFIASKITFKASSFGTFKLGAKPPSSPTEVLWP